jgi:hypothetical protein
MSVQRVSRSYLCEKGDGTVIEYRRVFYHNRASMIDLEYRILGPGGVPFNDDWFVVEDGHLLWLQMQCSDIPALLSAELPL